MINQQLTLPLDEIVAFCKRNPIRKLSLFGSVLRDDFGPDSDVDVLIEVEPEAHITYLDLAGFQLDLEAIIGREVDLVTPNALSQYFKGHVLQSAALLYEQE